MARRRLRGIFLADNWAYERVYGSELAAEFARRIDLIGPPLELSGVRAQMAILQHADVILASWGIPLLDAEFLSYAPNLRAVFLGAGSVKAVTSDAFWDRGIPIVSAYQANAVPVSEFALATILFSLKHGWRYALGMQRERRFIQKSEDVPGAFRTTVGLVSLGAIGRRVAQLLQHFDVRVVAYDPFCEAAQAARGKIELMSLAEVFAKSHVVSLHAPLLPETEGMITGSLIASMRPGATLINTARGALVREREMIDILRTRADLTAVLDLTSPYPPAPDSPLFALPNVVLTPHIAGAADQECKRLGYCILEELDRFLAGEPLRWAITREMTARLA